VLPVFKELNSILFYPVQYEGEESERNVFYTGAAPNQQAIPAVDYLMKDEKVKRWVLAGTDYVYPRTTNKILEAYLKSKGVKQEDIMINYTPFVIATGRRSWPTSRSSARPARRPPWSPPSRRRQRSVLQGARQPGHQGDRHSGCRILGRRRRTRRIDTKPLVGHLAAWNYFQSIKTLENEKFIKAWQAYTKNPKRVTNDPMEAHVIGFDMWVKAVEKAKSVDADKVIDALPGIEAKNLTAAPRRCFRTITSPSRSSSAKSKATASSTWCGRPGAGAGDAWSKELEGSKDLIGDWVGKKCGNYNTKTNKCGGQGS